MAPYSVLWRLTVSYSLFVKKLKQTEECKTSPLQPRIKIEQEWARKDKSAENNKTATNPSYTLCKTQDKMPSYYASKMQKKKANALCGCGLNATMQKPFTDYTEVVYCVECYWDDYKSYEEYEVERRLRHAENKKQIVGRTRSWTLFKRELAQVGEEVRLARWDKAVKDEKTCRLAACWDARRVYDEVLERRDQAVTIILKLQGKTTTTRASFVAFVVACKRAYLDYDKVAAEELAARIKYNGMLDEC